MHQEGDGPPDPQSSTIENLIVSARHIITLSTLESFLHSKACLFAEPLTMQGTFYKAFATGTALYGTASIFYRFTVSRLFVSWSLFACLATLEWLIMRGS